MTRAGAYPWESLETLAFCSTSNRLLFDWSEIVMIWLTQSCEDHARKIETMSIHFLLSCLLTFPVGHGKNNIICPAAPQSGQKAPVEMW